MGQAVGEDGEAGRAAHPRPRWRLSRGRLWLAASPLSRAGRRPVVGVPPNVPARRGFCASHHRHSTKVKGGGCLHQYRQARAMLVKSVIRHRVLRSHSPQHWKRLRARFDFFCYGADVPALRRLCFALCVCVHPPPLSLSPLHFGHAAAHQAAVFAVVRYRLVPVMACGVQDCVPIFYSLAELATSAPLSAPNCVGCARARVFPVPDCKHPHPSAGDAVSWVGGASASHPWLPYSVPRSAQPWFVLVASTPSCTRPGSRQRLTAVRYRHTRGRARRRSVGRPHARRDRR